MKKSKRIGGISFTTEGYENFVTLSSKEQFEQVYNSLNPRDEAVAKQALKNVPNGDISKGNGTQDKSITTEVTDGSGKANTAKPGNNKS